MSATPSTHITEDAVRLEVLHDASAAAGDLPVGLTRRYGGGLGIDGPCVYANFVTSLDGVVALEMKHSPAVISEHSDADRFVMGLLRARADAVLIGGGTLRADPGHAWTPAYIYPDAADEFVEMRRAQGQAEDPRLIVLTASGDIDPDEPALAGALVVTSPVVGPSLRRKLPSSTTVRTLETVAVEAVVRLLLDEGLEVVLSEAGPRLFGELVTAGCLDELFLTLSPVVAGSAARGRKPLSEGFALPTKALARMDLVSTRRAASHLFLRYRTRARRSGITS